MRGAIRGRAIGPLANQRLHPGSPRRFVTAIRGCIQAPREGSSPQSGLHQHGFVTAIRAPSARLRHLEAERKVAHLEALELLLLDEGSNLMPRVWEVVQDSEQV